MQKSLDEQWPPLMRTRSGNSRDNKKVTCETLSKVDWYSRRPYKAQLYYHSDGDEEGDGEGEPASEAEDEHEDDDKDRDEDHKEGIEGRGLAGKLESQGYGEGSSVQGHHFLACFPSKLGYDKPYISISSPGQDVKRTERGPRTYPSPIPHSGSLLPHSGKLLPHSGPLKLHVGSHSNILTNSKLAASNRGSTLIPSNIAGKSSKSPGFSNAYEPSSPKVNCLGRVKIKQKYCREMGKLADMCAATRNDKTRQSIGDQMKKLRRKKPHAVEVVQLRKEGLRKVTEAANIAEGGKEVKVAVLSSAGAMAELRKSKHGWSSSEEATIMTDAASDSETKVKIGLWRLKEARSHRKSHLDKQKWHPPDALEVQCSSLQVDCSIDLSRFRSAECVQGQKPGLPKSLASLSPFDGSQRIEQRDNIEFVPPVAPLNSLLLMRNSKNRGARATITASSSSRRHGADSCVYGHTDHEEPVRVSGANRQVCLSSSKEGSSLHHISSSLLGLKMEELATMADGYEQTPQLKVKKQCSVTHQECKLLQVKMNAIARGGQASLPNEPPEASLWQRRSIVKPSSIDVRKPITTR